MCRLTKYLRALNLSLLLFFLLSTSPALSKELYVTGKVSDNSMFAIPDALVSLTINAKDFVTTTASDGSYTIRISGLLPPESSFLEVESPFPNPFSHSVNIPVCIVIDGDLFFSVYDLTGRKIYEMNFPSLMAGSYRIIWDGKNQAGSPQPAGLYLYSVSFKGRTISGKLLKTAVVSSFSSSSGIEYSMPLPVFSENDEFSVPVIVTVNKDGYHTLRLTDISITQDTIMDFMIRPSVAQPFKTSGNHIAQYDNPDYKAMILKGINLGSSPPGTFPGEIAYAVTPDMYERWLNMMAQSGFNSIRVYTLHPPVFYELLARHNYRNPSKPLFLFQGIWLDEVEDPYDPNEYDLIARSDDFMESIREVIDCMHGRRKIDFRMGRAHGLYNTDISPWIAGYIIGREVSPQEIDSTNQFHPGAINWSGTHFTISNAEPSEIFVTRMLDETVNYEWVNYGFRRPVSFSSWPTLDPLTHPTEIFTDEDKMSIDVTKITEVGEKSMLFASYHAYPYYPDFMNDDPDYREYSDDRGPNSYLGYLTALKSHYSSMPLVIGEFGVPSSWGSAHESFSDMPHGGVSEDQQGAANIRQMKNILSSGCAGGFMFAWMDEWFKRTWIVEYLEAFSSQINGNAIPTRQLWHNIVSPEQNFGLIAFEESETSPWWNYTLDENSSSISSIKARHDVSFFYLDIQLTHNAPEGDTIMIAFDTYLKDTGESTLPRGATIQNRSEFLLHIGEHYLDTANFYVTQAYNMFGLSPRFNFSDPLVQKFKSTVSDEAPWQLMRWINNGFDGTVFDIGKLPVERSASFTPGKRTAVAWKDNRILVRIPWTMLYFYDPTQMRVIDGAVSFDGGYNFQIESRISDGIAVSVHYETFGPEVINTTTRYTWPTSTVVPPIKEREKSSLRIVSNGLNSIPGYVW